MTPLALQVVRDAGRARVFHLLGLAAIGLLATAPLLSALSMGARQRGLVDLGLTALWLLCISVALYVGATAIGTDLERGSGAIFLARPISVARFAAGRLAGALLTLGLFCLGVAAVFFVVAASRGVFLPLPLLGWTVLVWAEASVVAALAMLLSSLTRVPLAVFGGAGLWVAGHLLAPYGALAREEGATGMLAVHGVLALVLPDLAVFDAQSVVVAGGGPSMAALGVALAVAGLWVVAPFCATVLVLKHRDLA